MGTQYTSDRTAVWLQRECGDPLEFLGCYDVSDLVINEGDYSTRKKRVSKGKFANIGYQQDTPDFAGSVSFRFYRDIVDLIADLPCPPNIYIYYSNCGADDDLTNYDFIDLLSTFLKQSRTQANVVRNIAVDGETDTGGDITVALPGQFLGYDVIKTLSALQFTIGAIETHVVNDVAVCDPDPNCGDCEDETEGCQTIWVVTDGLVGSASVAAAVYKTVNGGTSWSAISNPFSDTDDNITDVACSGDVVILANGTTASYAYSNDGTTFSEITTPTQIISDVEIVSETKIWMVAAAGFVYFSNTRGVSIATQDAGVATSENLNSVSFADSELGYAVGATNAFITTEDGETWAAGTGPSPATVLNKVKAAKGTEILFVGDADGELFRSVDKGVTWTTARSADTNTSGGITDIEIKNCNVVLFSANDASGNGHVYKSIDGGNTWEEVIVDTNTGINAIAGCDINTYWLAGDDGFVEKLYGTSFREVTGAN